jgi:hypothetical protein
MRSRIYLITVVVFALAWTTCGCAAESSRYNVGATTDNSELDRAFKERRSNVQVEGEGTVDRLLDDDVDGSRHQRFIVRLPSGQTILILHNIDIAPRVDNPQHGDSIRFYGEYIWSAQGGKVHWTHTILKENTPQVGSSTKGRHISNKFNVHKVSQ